MNIPIAEQPNSDAGRLPWLTVEHDGTQAEISAEEQKLVALKFTSLVDDLMLNHPDKIKRRDAVGSATNHLSLKRSTLPDEHWHIAVKQTDVSEASALPDIVEISAISLQRIEGVLGREGADYYLGLDGVVRRKDFGDIATKVEKESSMDPPAPREDISPPEALLGLTALGNAMGQLIENSRLEQRMGVNMQPVGIAELDALSEYVTHPDVVVQIQSY